MAENTEQKKGSVDASDYDKVAADNKYLKFLLQCFVDHHTDVNKLNEQLMGSLLANASNAVSANKQETENTCTHPKTKWNILFTSGTCQVCGHRLTGNQYLPKT